MSDRDATIKEIRNALKRRSGKPWSVTGGRGTAWGWITIDAPPQRRTMRHRVKAGAVGMAPGDYEEYDSGQPGGNMTLTERQQLAQLLGLERVHFQGQSIPSSFDYYQEYIDRANGHTPSVYGKQYWD